MLFSISFNSLNRPECLKRAMGSVCDGGWKFASKLVCDDASTDANFETILRYCEEFEFDLIKKKKRMGWPNSCNLSMIYGDSRYAITSNDDMVIVENSKWLEKTQEGFERDYGMVSLLRLDTFALDKEIIPGIGWHDERYPFVGIEDGDWTIRMRIYTGKFRNYAYVPGMKISRKSNDLIKHTPHAETMDEPRMWVVIEENEENIKFFFQKWKVDKEAILARFPKLKGCHDRSFAQKAYNMMAVERIIEEEDFYPDISQRYKNGNFEAWQEKLPCVEEIYRFNKETI